MLLEQFREQKPSLATRIYVLLVSLFVGLLILTNVITSKYIQVAHLTFTAGSLTYPFTFLLLDLITELYGKERAKLVIWLGLLASLFMTGIIYLASMIPIYAHSMITQHAFEAVFGFTPGIVVGSMVAYLAAQFLDVYLFDWFKQLTKGKYLWFRNNTSTLIAQFFDTALFAGIAWIIWPLISPVKGIQPIDGPTWYQVTINEFGLKVAFTWVSIPLVYGGVYLIRRYIKA